jgi:AmiR/NasT family two-component response regulator
MLRTTGWFPCSKKNEQLQNRIEDIKVIDRAKCLLVQFMHVTEPEAHRLIEKGAMTNVRQRERWLTPF